MLGKRIEARERLEHAVGRQDLVELLEDHGALDGPAVLPHARRLQHDDADQPGEAERERDRQHGAQQPVEGAEDRRADARPHRAGDALRAGRQDHPADERAEQAEERRVRRRVALLEQLRAEARAEVRAAGEADERQRPDEKPAREADRARRTPRRR